jgi:hypothetical protein
MDSLSKIDPDQILGVYNWKDCGATFVCVSGDWKCTSAQFYQRNECGPFEPTQSGPGANPLEGYAAPVEEAQEPTLVDPMGGFFMSLLLIIRALMGR